MAGALGVTPVGPPRGPAGPENRRYELFNREIAEAYEAVNLDRAEILVYPHCAYVDPAEVLRAAALAKEHGLPLVVLAWGDQHRPIELPNGLIYCQSLNSDERLACERCLPAVCSDVLAERGQEQTVRPWREKPSVGFCGFVSNPLMRAVYRLSGRTRKAHGLALRNRVLKRMDDVRIETAFIRRQVFLASVRARRMGERKVDPFTARREFLDNLLGNDYALCVRGAGNFSIRFYEVLAAGRIPLLINTKCVLPFEDKIEWKKHCLIIEESELDRAADIFLELHRQLGEEQFRAMQVGNRRLWQDWLSPQAFIRRAIAEALPVAAGK
jgi:hypothetical protein